MGFVVDVLVGKCSGNKKPWCLRGYSPEKKKQVALIMLIIALQFDVSTSFNM